MIKSQQLLSKSLSEINEIKGSIIGNVQFLLNEQQNEMLSMMLTISSKPNLVVQRKLQTLDFIHQKVQSQSLQFIQKKSSEMNHFVKVMKLMSPVNILKKGFAIISMNDKVLINTDDVAVGSKLKINMYQSEIDTVVTKKDDTDGKKYDL